MRINGSRRWVGYGQFVFQPSELAKIAALFFLAAWFSRYEKAGNNVTYGFLIQSQSLVCWRDLFSVKSILEPRLYSEQRPLS
jgi:cell division protein FtsW (lipid II flippase)